MSTSPNRISPLSQLTPVGRLTPREDFSGVLSAAAGVVGRVATVALGTSIPGGVVTAVTHLTGAGRDAVQAPGVARSQVAVGPGGAGGGVVGDPLAGLEVQSGSDLLAMQRQLQQEGVAQSAQYLQLQDQMQRESRQYSAVSNVMKVRHDSAKAAINNIR